MAMISNSKWNFAPSWFLPLIGDTANWKKEPNLNTDFYYTTLVIDIDASFLPLLVEPILTPVQPLLHFIGEDIFANTSSLRGQFAYSIQRTRHSKTPTEIKPSPAFTILR